MLQRISSIKYLAFAFLLTLLFLSCTKDCCYNGNVITPDVVLDNVGSNEITDSLFSATISGTLNSIGGKPLKNLTIVLTDTLGREFKFMTDNNGKFERNKLLSGKYNLRFENLPLYKYSFDEYNTIIQDLTAIIHGPKIASKAEKIAYHVLDFDDGLTTLDRAYFIKFKDREADIINFNPWRLISTSDFNSNNLKIQDNLDITIKENENFASDILLIYIGDPAGFTL